jgi:diacylglycerol kinase (ATP)
MPETTEPAAGSPAAPAPEAAGPAAVPLLHKRPTGIARLMSALGHSLAGLRAGWQERAFRLEIGCATVLLPASLWLGRSWVETAVLAGTVMIVLIVELLNSGIEAAVDRIGPERHPLSKRAKDLGSAAVMLSLLLCGFTWAAALLARSG